MADLEGIENPQNAEPEKRPKRGILSWLIPALVVVLCASAGFVVGRLFGTRGGAKTASAAEQSASFEAQSALDTKGEDGTNWYYDMEPVVGNLNEPGVSRYVRVSLTLEMDSGMEQKQGIAFLESKTPLLKHWLTLYLSNQTIEDIRGEKRLRHVQAEISSSFNQGLFPEGKQHIKRVLFKELSIQ
ncbi:MAG: flagellar basal body-associated FliL family protein [Sedimentisphaerales bacterium]|nr:flagellar basal body-associated FliL family protein [Sedimentisphaerales bacterium]